MSPAVAFGSFVLLFRLTLPKPQPLKAHQPLKAQQQQHQQQSKHQPTKQSVPAMVCLDEIFAKEDCKN